MSTDAPACPQCGAPPRIRRKRSGGGVGTVLFVLAVGWLVFDPQGARQRLIHSFIAHADGGNSDVTTMMKWFNENDDINHLAISKDFAEALAHAALVVNPDQPEQTFEQTIIIISNDASCYADDLYRYTQKKEINQGVNTALMAISIKDSLGDSKLVAKILDATPNN